MSKAPHSLFARVYDLFMVPQDRLGLHRQRARLCATATGRVLEVAIGTGLNIPHYGDATSVVGVDRDVAMLRRAVRRTWESRLPIRLLAADAHDLPFGAASFDSVVVGLSLCTIPDPTRALAEIGRVTTPDARLHFLEHVRSAKKFIGRVQDRITPVWESLSGGCRANQNTVRLLDESSWSVETLWTSDGGGLIQGIAAKK